MITLSSPKKPKSADECVLGAQSYADSLDNNPVMLIEEDEEEEQWKLHHSLFTTTQGESVFIFCTGHHLFNNFYWAAPLTIGGVDYKTVEHFCQVQKGLFFEDEERYERILRVWSPSKARKVGMEIEVLENGKN